MKQLDINLVTVGLKAIGLFLLSNLIAILFLLGLAFIIYAIFIVSTIAGYIAVGLALILIALILAKESSDSDT